MSGQEEGTPEVDDVDDIIKTKPVVEDKKQVVDTNDYKAMYNQLKSTNESILRDNKRFKKEYTKLEKDYKTAGEEANQFKTELVEFKGKLTKTQRESDFNALQIEDKEAREFISWKYDNFSVEEGEEKPEFKGWVTTNTPQYVTASPEVKEKPVVKKPIDNNKGAKTASDKDNLGWEAITNMSAKEWNEARKAVLGN